MVLPSSVPAIHAKAGGGEWVPRTGGNSGMHPIRVSGIQGKEFGSALSVPHWVSFAFCLLTPVSLPPSSTVRGLRPRLTLCRVIFLGSAHQELRIWYLPDIQGQKASHGHLQSQ